MIFKFKKLNKTLIFNGRKITDASDDNTDSEVEKKNNQKILENNKNRLTAIKELLAYRLYSDIPYVKGILNDNFEVDASKLNGATKKNIALLTEVINSNPIISTLKEVNKELQTIVDKKAEQKKLLEKIKEAQAKAQQENELKKKNVLYEEQDHSALENSAPDNTYLTSDLKAITLVKTILNYVYGNYKHLIEKIGNKRVLVSLWGKDKKSLEQYIMSDKFEKEINKTGKNGRKLNLKAIYEFPEDIYHVDEFVARWSAKIKEVLLETIGKYWEDFHDRLSSSEQTRFKLFEAMIKKSNETPYGLLRTDNGWSMFGQGMSNDLNVNQREEDRLNGLEKNNEKAKEGLNNTGDVTGINERAKFGI